MELRHLMHFVAVAEERNFTRAAARLHIVQSGLSVSIRTLERELGSRLFDRSAHSVNLTTTGEVFLEEAIRVLEAAERAREAVADVQGGVRGSVRIGIMQSMVLHDLPGLLATFRASRPRVEIIPTTLPGGSLDLVEAVAQDRLDVAFAALPDTLYDRRRQVVVPLTSEELVLALPPQHALIGQAAPVPIRALEGQAFVEFPRGWGNRQTTDQLFLAHEVERDVAVEVADIPTAVGLVQSGFGAAFLIPAAIPDASSLDLVRVEGAPQFTISMVSSRTRRQAAVVRTFTTIVTQHFRRTNNGAQTLPDDQ